MQEYSPAPDEPLQDAASQSLARAAQGGDVDCFAQLYERIAPALYAWASLRIRPALRAHVEPEDVVQEVWCRAFKALPGVDLEHVELRAWIFRIAKNVLLEAFRKLQRTSTGPGNPGPSTRLLELHDVPDSATNISRRLARDEGLQVVLKWVGGLEEDERKLFVHCGLEGLSYAEVSERMQVDRATIAKRWQSLRRRIAQFGPPKDLLVG